MHTTERELGIEFHIAVRLVKMIDVAQVSHRNA